MGVFECGRKGCNNIMCDRVPDEHGYICGDCFNELVSLGVTVNIELFMICKPVNTKESCSYYNEIFKKKGKIIMRVEKNSKIYTVIKQTEDEVLVEDEFDFEQPPFKRKIQMWWSLKYCKIIKEE